MAGGLDRVGRWFRQSATGRYVAAHLGAFYIRFVSWTTRWDVQGLENRANVLASGGGVIAAFWHGRLFLSPLWVPKDRRGVAMISNNRDGELITAVVRRFGVHAVRGSTDDHAKKRDKGGAEAFSDAHQELTRNKALIGITPDGPRGPRMRAQRGAALLAIKTRAPILPITFSTAKGKTTRGWDRFVIPFPFGRGVQVYGTPLWPPEADDDQAVDDFQQQIEAALTEITNRADQICGRPRVEPGPPIGPSIGP